MTIPFSVPLPFVYSFNTAGTLYEAGSAYESTSPYWYLNSGGKLVFTGSTGETVQGTLAANDPTRLMYAASNPTDTDNGYHPQNLFRLVTQSNVSGNASQEARFYISGDELSKSSNRNQSNGLLLFSRYQAGGQTLYYAGIRVDGTAVIKKKIQESSGAFGNYYTMAQKQIFAGTYNASAPVVATGTSANLLPHHEWIGLKETTTTNADGSVTITLFMQRAGQTTWTELLQAMDSGQYDKTAPITTAGKGGIRTDFMDAGFKNYRVTQS